MWRRFSQNLPLSTRLVVAYLPVLSGIILLGTMNMLSAWATAEQQGQTRDLARFTVQVSDLVHELQRERGASAVFLNSNGAQMAAELPDQQGRAEARLEAVRAGLRHLRLDAYPAAIGQRINAAMTAVVDLPAKRVDIKAQRLRGTESNQFFVALIAQFLAISRDAVKSSVDFNSYEK